ncbi:MAG: GH1 family beta-glucosidase [Myxococcaceae bacterium]|jgi:beta-glucosidase|nr:GH1 family beta-glucosidase [Myxococcaceae bacterium]
MSEARALPTPFLWGAATSSFQIEGASAEGGRGESIWDRYCQRPGAIADGSDGRVACDHFHRFREDLGLVRELGLGAYRFSIAWPRVVPLGTGAVNEQGLDFYERLVDGCLEHGLRPMATLYHWDLPQALQDRGGWASRDLVSAFERYADVVTRRLGDRVKDWVTINEPWCVAVLGHVHGVQAPGLKDWTTGLRVAHHVLLAHGRAVPVIHSNVPASRAGIVVILSPSMPASDSAADVAAARAFDGEFHRWYLDPLHGRGYPQDKVAEYTAAGHGAAFEAVQPGDLDTIATPTDFLGVNYYSRAIVRSSAIPEAENRPRTIPVPDPAGLTDMGWEVYPRGLFDSLVHVHREYRPKRLFVTENGAAYATGPDATGRVRDEARRVYLEGHLTACCDAVAAGVPLEGYFVWSLLDNFEWSHGYQKRFGLVHVDFATQRRTIKDSGRWLAQVLRENRLGGKAP